MSGAKRAVNRAGDLLARAGFDRAAQGKPPAVRRRGGFLKPQVRKYRSLINVTGDLFGPALGGDVLCAHQLRAPVIAGHADQVLGYQRNGSPRAFLPRRVGRRVNHHLTDHSPAGVVGVAARDEEPRERLSDTQRPWFRRVAVEVS